MQARTGIPMVLLDGALERTPAVLRALGAALGRTARAEQLARLAEQVTGADRRRAKPHTVVYARGPDGLTVVAPGALAAEVFAVVHWQVLAPPGKGHFRHTSVQEIAALDPDMLVFAGPAIRRNGGGLARVARAAARSANTMRLHRAEPAVRLDRASGFAQPRCSACSG